MIGKAETEGLEPGFGAVLAVGVAEFGFEDTSFVAGANELHESYQQHEQKSPPRHRRIEHDSEKNYRTEKIDRIAYFGVDACGHESARFRSGREEFPDLQPRDQPSNISGCDQHGSGDVVGSPGTVPSEIRQIDRETTHRKNFPVVLV